MPLSIPHSVPATQSRTHRVSRRQISLYKDKHTRGEPYHHLWEYYWLEMSSALRQAILQFARPHENTPNGSATFVASHNLETRENSRTNCPLLYLEDLNKQGSHFWKILKMCMITTTRNKKDVWPHSVVSLLMHWRILSIEKMMEKWTRLENLLKAFS